MTRQGGYQTNLDRQRYVLLTDGSLCVHELDDADGGEYRCNQQLVAELQVLVGKLRHAAKKTKLQVPLFQVSLVVTMVTSLL